MAKRFLYVANFRSARVEVYNTNFQRVRFEEDAFDDDTIPVGFAPFNIQNIGGSLFVTYAKQDALRHDPVAGAGLGFVDIFSTTGKLEGRLEDGDWFTAGPNNETDGLFGTLTPVLAEQDGDEQQEGRELNEKRIRGMVRFLGRALK
jgi:hypothetical protein